MNEDNKIMFRYSIIFVLLIGTVLIAFAKVNYNYSNEKIKIATVGCADFLSTRINKNTICGMDIYNEWKKSENEWKYDESFSECISKTNSGEILRKDYKVLLKDYEYSCYQKGKNKIQASKL